jgi:hypothetical protein
MPRDSAFSVLLKTRLPNFLRAVHVELLPGPSWARSCSS